MTYRQEYLAGQAEDQYWLVDLNQHVSVPFGAFRHAALTLEWSRLEPNVIDRKQYVRGIGVVSERAAQGPPEQWAPPDRRARKGRRGLPEPRGLLAQ